MKIGIHQNSFGNMSLARCFARTRKTGAQGLLLSFRSKPEIDLLSRPGYLSRVEAIIDKTGVPVAGLHLGYLCEEPFLIGTDADFSVAEGIIDAAVTIAERIDAPVVLVPFHGKNRIELPEEAERAAEYICRAAEHFEGSCVSLAVEAAMPPHQLKSLVSGADWIAKICLDTGDVTASRIDPGIAVRELGAGAIAQIHLRDVRVISSLPPDFNVRLGRGDVKFNSVAQALQAVSYDGWVILEPPPGDEHGEIQAANVAYARAMLGLDEAKAPLVANAISRSDDAGGGDS